MPHGVEPRSKSKDNHGPIPGDPIRLQAWWRQQPQWAQALDVCMQRKRADAMVMAGEHVHQWRGDPWIPSHDAIRWIHGYLCRTPGLGAAKAMGALASSLVAAGGIREDGMLRPGLLVDATRADRADLVEWILSLPENTRLASDIWPHLAHIAAANGSLRCLDLALERQPGVAMHANAKGRTTLHIAAGYGQALIIKRLLAAGANAMARDTHGRTPLAGLMTGHREINGWNNNTERAGWQDMAMMLIRAGEGPEQNYGKTARAGTLADRVRREIGPGIADELVNLGHVHRSQVALEADTDTASGGTYTPGMPRL